MWSGRARPCVDDRPNMLATQRGGEPAQHESVHDLHTLDVSRCCHYIEERTIERQRAFVRCEVGDGGLPEELRLLPTRTFGAVVYTPSTSSTIVKPGRSERVGDQKRTRVSPVIRDT